MPLFGETGIALQVMLYSIFLCGRGPRSGWRGSLGWCVLPYRGDDEEDFLPFGDVELVEFEQFDGLAGGAVCGDDDLVLARRDGDTRHVQGMGHK